MRMHRTLCTHGGHSTNLVQRKCTFTRRFCRPLKSYQPCLQIQLWALKILSLMIALELRHRAHYGASAFLRTSSQLWARVWPGVVAVMRRHAWTRGYAALSKVGLRLLSVFLRCGFVQPAEVLRSQKHLVHIIDEGVRFACM